MTHAGTKTQEISPQAPSKIPPLRDSGVIHSRDVFALRLYALWTERRLVGRCTLAGIILGVVLALLLPERFESSARLMPPENQSTSSMAMLAAMASRTGAGFGAIAGDLLGLKSTGAVFIGIFRSRTVQERLVQRFELKKVYSEKFDEDACLTLGQKTAISEDRQSGIITISVTDRNPERAAAIARAYIEELDHLVAELSTSSAHRERVFLEDRLRTVKQAMDQASHEFSQFASKNMAIDIKEQAKAMVEAAARLEGELIAAESQLKGLEEIYTPDNFRVRAAQARIDELRKQREALGGRPEIANNSSLEKQEQSPYPSIRSLPILGVTYADLYMRTRIPETVYEILTQQYELAKVQEAKETPSVKVLDAPKIPFKRAFPPRRVVMSLSGLLAFMLSAAWVLGRRGWAQLETHDPTKVLAQDVVRAMRGNLPWAEPNGSRLQAISNRFWARLTRKEQLGSPKV